MKMIMAVIQPYKLEKVNKELGKSGINLLTVTEVLGHGRQKGVTEPGKASKQDGRLLKKIQLQIFVNDDAVEGTIKTIIKGTKTGKIGDGKIFVMDVKDCVRISTGERGWPAIA